LGTRKDGKKGSLCRTLGGGGVRKEGEIHRKSESPNKRGGSQKKNGSVFSDGEKKVQQIEGHPKEKGATPKDFL